VSRKGQQVDTVSIMLQETTWTVPEAVAVKADALKLTPEKAAIVRMLKANKTVAANLRADLRGGSPAVLKELSYDLRR
jgi:hypothetical protein